MNSSYRHWKGVLKGQTKFGKRLLRGVWKRKNFGYCPVCGKSTLFVAYSDWLRDDYRCIRCYSIPRQRALFHALERFFPEWRKLTVHESSPGGISLRYLRPRCPNYTYSQYFTDLPLGSERDGVRCENLAHLTYPDNNFDLFITQDVFEHIFDPEKAFSEIQRVLKPGGAHIFTMPWYPELDSTINRAELVQDNIVYYEPAVYHRNPVDKNGSLVVNDWGKDFTSFIRRHSDMETMVFLYIDRRLGLDAKYLEVFISFKLQNTLSQ